MRAVIDFGGRLGEKALLAANLRPSGGAAPERLPVIVLFHGRGRGTHAPLC
eukprot:gene54466-62551_t